MTRRANKLIRLVKVLICGGIVAWGVVSWWSVRQARRAGTALVDTLRTEWPEDGSPRFDTRDKVLGAARNMGEGRFGRVVSDLGPVESLSPEKKVAAQRFFAQAGDARKRFIAASDAAQAQEQDGADVSAVRDALARALVAASDRDEAAVVAQVELAERALDEIGTGSAVRMGGKGASAVAGLVRRIEPAFNLGSELLTEGHAAVEKLVSRASWHCQAKEYRQAASLVELAAGLLGVEPSGPAAGATPQWFDALAQPPSVSATEAQAGAVVGLCEAMAMSEETSKPVTSLVKKARRELDAGRSGEAYWWASVALNALGMSDEAIAASAETADTSETSQQESPE
jgi:hypothetical protein